MTAAVQSAAWEELKARERAAAATSALDGVPLALPALMRAFKLSRRAARVGFDFERPQETADKVAEELAEVREASTWPPPTPTGPLTPARRRARSSRRSAICCSRRRISRASSMSTRRRRCVRPT